MGKINFRKRLIIITSLFLAIFGLIIINLVRIQIFGHEKWHKIAYNQYDLEGDIRGERGTINTVNNVKVAYDSTKFKLNLDPTQINDHLEKLTYVISDELGINQKSLKDEILSKKKRGRKYLNVKNKITKDEKDRIIKRLSRKEKVGLYFNSQKDRVYSKGAKFNHILGFLNIDRVGVYGIEKTFEKYLKEEVGYQKRYVATKNNFDLPVGKKQDYVPPKNGKDIFLTIDYVMQHILEEELVKIFEESQSDWAAGIVMEPDTGKIRAISSLPIIEERKYIRNNAIYNQYEPGSVFKPLVIAMALERGLLDYNERFQCDGSIEVYNKTIREHDRDIKGNLSVEEILTKSSNVGMVKIGQRFSNLEFYNQLKRYGFGERTGIDLSGERKINLQDYKRWSGLKIPTMSFGQGIAVTPIQMATAFSAIINGGILYKPQIVDRIENDGKEILKTYPSEEIRRVASPEISEKMRDYLYSVVDEGTGKSAQISGYKIGGKTGTSQKSDGVRGYSSGKHTSSFVGFYYGEDDKYLILTVFDDPKGDKFYGSQLASPAFKNTLKRILKYKDIMPEKKMQDIIILDEKKKTVKKDTKEKINDVEFLPDFKGKTIREAISFLNNHNIEVKIKGEGYISRQFPQPGTRMKNLESVSLILEE
ncbi:MAG: penicillin-binding protein [Fusobacteriota bacterium]